MVTSPFFHKVALYTKLFPIHFPQWHYETSWTLNGECCAESTPVNMNFFGFEGCVMSDQRSKSANIKLSLFTERCLDRKVVSPEHSTGIIDICKPNMERWFGSSRWGVGKEFIAWRVDLPYLCIYQGHRQPGQAVLQKVILLLLNNGACKPTCEKRRCYILR